MAIKFTELVRKGECSASGGGNDKYLNMIKSLTGQGKIVNDNLQLLVDSFEITPDCFDETATCALLNFPYNMFLTSIETPENIKYCEIDVEVCNRLESVNLSGFEKNDPYSDGLLDGSMFRECVNLKTLKLPKFIGSLEYTFVSNCNGHNNIETLVIPQIYKIASNTFIDAYKLKVIDFRGRTSSEIPLLENGAFYLGSGINCKIVVPDALYDTWTHAENWSNLCSNNNKRYELVKESEYVE